MQLYQIWYDCMQYIPELVYLQYANYNSMRDIIYMLGGDQPLLGGEFCLGGVDPPWVKAGLPKKGLSPPIEGRSYTQKLVTDLGGWVARSNGIKANLSQL